MVHTINWVGARKIVDLHPTSWIGAKVRQMRVRPVLVGFFRVGLRKEPMPATLNGAGLIFANQVPICISGLRIVGEP